MIDLSGLNVAGISLGGFASSLDVPEFKVAVDLGRCIERVVARDLILITHAHLDHLGSLAQHSAQRGLRRLEPATYVVPPGVKEHVEELLRIWRRLDGGELGANLVTLEPGESHKIRRDLSVRAFETEHRVVSQGYLFERTILKLAHEFEGASADEIVAAKQAGRDVTVPVTRPELAVTGDTVIDAILGNPEVLGCPRLVMECTFLDERVSVQKARDMGHIHLDEIREAAGLFHCDALLLNHVSPRHSKRDALDLLRAALPPGLMERTQLMVGQA